MIVKINGKEKTLSGELTLSALIEFLNLSGDRIAVELNREIAKKSHWDKTYIKEGDSLEIVSFVGGG